MNKIPPVVEKHIELTVDRADRLSRLAQEHHLSEDQFIEKALDILFTITDLYEAPLKAEGIISSSTEDSISTSQTGDENSDIEAREALFQKKLLEVGLISEIRSPYHSAIRDDFVPIEVKGKPLSEFIIEERQ
ncbi:MAG: hypothetical protein EXR62_07110 [Chloroflexi bacterium]|nr:hypothetical protein [Chloroflexota bacterium]